MARKPTATATATSEITQENVMSDQTTDTTDAADAVTVDANGLVARRTVRINKELPVLLENKWAARIGQPLTAEDANHLFIHASGQFGSTESANEKNRQTRYAKATDDAAREANRPRTAEELQALWLSYVPSVRGTETQSAAEKTRNEAGRLVWTEIVEEHNTAVKAGQPPILKVNHQVTAFPPRPVKKADVSTEAHKEAVKAWEAQCQTYIDNVLAKAELADRVQAMVDKLNAAKGAKVEAAPAPVAAPADLL